MKTSKEFDYNLWAIEENGSKRYFCRIKATGEECEISLECMRVLLSEDKKIKRYYEKLAEYGSILSLDVYSESEDAEKLCWQVDTTDMVEEVIADMLEAEFIKELSERQLDVYLHSMKAGVPLIEYAKKNNLHYDTLRKVRNAIRKKFKIFLEDMAR